jgi:hypothetical protein
MIRGNWRVVEAGLWRSGVRAMLGIFRCRRSLGNGPRCRGEAIGKLAIAILHSVAAEFDYHNTVTE